MQPLIQAMKAIAEEREKSLAQVQDKMGREGGREGGVKRRQNGQGVTQIMKQKE